MAGEQCLGFQSLYLPDSLEPEVQTVFYGVGEKVVLPCALSPKHLKERQKYWKTPFGQVDSTTPEKKNRSSRGDMYVLDRKESDDYSLVIPSITPNHSGDYECFSPSPHAEYFITVCSELVSNKIVSHPGSNVTLNCSSTKDVSIQWYRQRDPEKEELIVDTGDPFVARPADVGGRMHISEADTSLMIADLSEDDGGTYWCVVLLHDMYYNYDVPYDEGVEDTETDDDTWAKAEEATISWCCLVFKSFCSIIILLFRMLWLCFFLVHVWCMSVYSSG
uniref:Ig-like domain-containing protein n=1 Tax=Electrophorus electricus TaxID=8005 RepID=A0A4W4E2W7_ELEEL